MHSVAVDNSGEFIAAGLGGGRVGLWQDAQRTGAFEILHSSHLPGSVESVRFVSANDSVGGKLTLYAASMKLDGASGGVAAWEIPGFNELFRIPMMGVVDLAVAQTAGVMAIAQRLDSGRDRGRVTLRDISGKVVWEQGFRERVLSVALTNDAKVVASHTSAGEVEMIGV